MAKKTTQSSRRYNFSSFKERVDSIKIEPSLHLAKRVYDTAEVSHFLSTYEHWIEINLSKTFTDFAEKVAPLCQSLPQLVHHQDEIFQHLLDAISVNDPLALQPLLEMLAQFVHDLGPDFLPYYQQFLGRFTSLVVEQKDSDALEWYFNCLAFIFKYMARELSADPIPTFKCLRPLLNLKTKQYISRFSAQALSFLTRKTKVAESLIQECFSDQDISSTPYKQSLVTMFSEAMKNVGSALHRNYNIILGSMIKLADSNDAIIVVCDVVFSLLHHVEDCSPLYEQIMALEVHNDHFLCRLYVSLCFADSGRKVPDWDAMMLRIVALEKDNVDEVSVVQLWGATLRNCPENVLAKFSSRFFEMISSWKNGAVFLPFLETCFNLNAEKLVSFAQPHFQNFLNLHWKTYAREFSLFFLKPSSLLSIDEAKQPENTLRVIVPDAFYDYAADGLTQCAPDDMYWRLQILTHQKNAHSNRSALLIDCLQENADLVGLILSCLSTQDLSSIQVETLCQYVQTHLNSFISNPLFLQGLKSYTQTQSFSPEIYSSVIGNLKLPAHKVRLLSLQILSRKSDILNQCEIIEDTALTVQTARDIGLRMRHLAIAYNADSSDPTAAYAVPTFLLGQLTSRFMPSWQGASSALSEIVEKTPPEIWNTIMALLETSGGDTPTQFSEEPRLAVPLSLDQRVCDNAGIASRCLYTYEHTQSMLCKRDYEPLQYGENARTQILRFLIQVPQTCESRSQDLVPFLLEEKPGWNVSERNLLIELFGKFGKVRKVNRSQEVYDYMLRILCSRSTHAQRMSLRFVLKYTNPRVLHYKDLLESLLDDALFRDTVSQIASSSSDISTEDVDIVMPLILRILYGRAQAPKQEKKFAVVSVLPNLGHAYAKEFIELGLRDQQDLRRMAGLVNMCADVLAVLGPSFTDVLSLYIDPVMRAITFAQSCIDSTDNTGEAAAARNIRTIGLRCLVELFDTLNTSFEWTRYIEPLYKQIIASRLELFAQENLQQPSSLLRLITMWSRPRFVSFLCIDSFAPAKAILDLLEHPNAKESVLVVALDFVNQLMQNQPDNDLQVELSALVVGKSIQLLPQIIERSTTSPVTSRALNLLTHFVENGFLSGADKGSEEIINSLSETIRKCKLPADLTAHIATLLGLLFKDFSCSLAQVQPLFETCCIMLRSVGDRRSRQAVCVLVQNVGSKFPELKVTADLVPELNAYSRKRIAELDFERRLAAYRMISTSLGKELTALQWMPILSCCLFDINNETELAIRSNATHCIQTFIDCKSDSQVQGLIEQVLVPAVRAGIRKVDDAVQAEWVEVLAHLVGTASEGEESSSVENQLASLKPLLFGEDIEANFFVNINHIQLHRRQRAIRRLTECEEALHEPSCVAHYLIPLVERYAFSNEEKVRNVANEACSAIGTLVSHITWHQFKALMKRYMSDLSSEEKFRPAVAVINSVCSSLRDVSSTRSSLGGKASIAGLPLSLDSYLTEMIIPHLTKTLNKKDVPGADKSNDIALQRSGISEALVSCVMCLSPENLVSLLPGVLTGLCQKMRSRSEELRDAVRKHLARIAHMLGAEYLRFILKELQSALTRGAQIHILAFTVHHILVSMADSLRHGDLDSCVDVIAGVIMEDVFGNAGSEKESEGYHSKAKEVRHGKSFDTAEIVCKCISLSSFSQLVHPVKLLLNEKLSIKSRNKLDQLLTKYSLGIARNEQSKNRDVLVLCHEIFTQARTILSFQQVRQKSAAAPHFLVQLQKNTRAQSEFSSYVSTLEKFSLDLLSKSITKVDRDPADLESFIPLLEECSRSKDDGVVVSSLRVLSTLVRVPFSEKTKEIFVSCSRTCCTILKNSPSLQSDLSQSALRFLSAAIRHADVRLKDSAISYVLLRIQPDLREPQRQGLAFGFLRAVVARHIVMPEVYDVMDSVAQIMVTSPSKEIRDMARAVFFQFLMEFDQGRGKLESHFAFLVNNLSYPSASGRQTIMEFIHAVVGKSSVELLSKLASSFFVALTNVAVTDDSSKCREMAAALIGSMIVKLGPGKTEFIEKCATTWAGKSPLLVRCAFQTYKLLLSEFGLGANSDLDALMLAKVNEILFRAKKESSDDQDWESIYDALNTFSVIAFRDSEAFFAPYKSTWISVIDCLLYPHAWVRLASGKLVGRLLQRVKETDLDEKEIQTIASRLFRQLGAPNVGESLGGMTVKSLALISMLWQEQNIYLEKDGEKTLAIDWAASRASSLMRNDHKDSFVAKKCAIKYTAMLCQIMTVEKLTNVAVSLLLPLYNFTDGEVINEKDEELKELALECWRIMEEKIGVADFTHAFSQVRQNVTQRRQERRSHRAQLAISAPDVSAKRKMRKHERYREKRKSDKDENGLYRHKRRRV